MKYGARPALLDERDYSFHRTFGTVNPVTIPTEYNTDIGLTMPDQNADGNPFSCTGYTTCDLATDQDGKIYAPEYTYMATLYAQGLPPETDGSDIKPALESAKRGMLPKIHMPVTLIGQGENFTAARGNWPDEVHIIASKEENIQGPYFNVWDDGGLDWYQGFQSAMIKTRADKRGISVGTPWFREWKQTGSDGILTGSFVYNGKPNSVGWHNWACKGWTRFNTKGELINSETGEAYLKVKSWQGKSFGDNGWAYMDRQTINRVMAIRGSVAYTQANAGVKEIFTIKLGIFETIILKLLRIIGIKQYA